MGIKVTRLYTGPDNGSHFDEIEIPLTDIVDTGGRFGEKGGTLKQWEVTKAKGVAFKEMSGAYSYGCHRAPRRQYIITLKGEWEIETGSGDKRRFGPGDILFAEDTTGRGHMARNCDDKPRSVIVVSLE